MQNEKSGSEIVTKNKTTAERRSDREMVLTRTFDAPARLVFAGWTKPELFKQWWISKELTLVSCEMDIRVGGNYRLVFDVGGSRTMAFYGTYLEVTPNSRLVWTNEEGDLGQSITTVTFEEKDGKTLLVLHELHASKEALDANIGSSDGMSETFDRLDEILVTQRTSGRA